ncbi:odorant receptor 42b-like isoform X4 [Drosophila navojoa]|uniref:odorant receptor 42b-like isoform X4 n=1 Tax=Drosophila navojoa TaxID=7232 RepID=UPI0011BDA84C|nr:odorant receptor 42b-like isoform X4 [Drosophila navojoa]
MIFEYIREPDGENLLAARDGYKYVDDIIVFLGWASVEGRGYIYRRLYRLYTVLVVIFSLYVPVLFVMSLMWTIDISHADTLFTTLEVFFNGPSYTIKSCIMLHNRWRVDKAKDMLDVMSERMVTYEERVKLHRLAVSSNYITITYRIVYMVPTTLNLIHSLYKGYPPLNLYNPFVDWHKDTLSLWIAAFCDYLLQIFAVHVFIGSDSMLLIFGSTMRSYTQWLKDRIEELRNNPEMTEDENYQQLVQCIKDHKLLVDYCENMRPLISRTMFVQYATVSLVLASTLIHLVSFADLISGITTAIYMTASLFQTFPFSYTCDLIVEDCENLALAIFHSHWMGASRPYKSALVYFIHKVQQPIIFLGGGVFPICLNINIQVAKFAFSLMTFVQQMSIFENFEK